MFRSAYTFFGCFISCTLLLFSYGNSILPEHRHSMAISPTLTYIEEHDPQVLRDFLHLPPSAKSLLFNQIEEIDLPTLMEAKVLIENSVPHSLDLLTPFDDFAFSGNIELKKRGQTLVNEGKVGCVVLAGGQGTRLKFDGPKGLYPISVIKQKTLFQMCAEKVLAASKLAGYPLKLAVMTSPENDDVTRRHFEEHFFFGLSLEQVSFFTQETLPFLDVEGKMFLEKPFCIAAGPSGNGHWLLSFVKSGLWDQWSSEGIDFVNIILVDNPLADPFDVELVGFHAFNEVDITVKCAEKSYPKEPVGVLVKQNGRCAVVEYSELSEEEKMALRPDGKLKHCCANLSLFCFSMKFIEQMNCEEKTLPLHRAWKAASYLNEEGKTTFSDKPIAWKFETFIFDWLHHADKVAALLYPREDCFAPLKNFSGADSPDTVRAALQAADHRCIEQLTGISPQRFPFELAADFHYPTAKLREKWSGVKISTSYVEP